MFATLARARKARLEVATRVYRSQKRFKRIEEGSKKFEKLKIHL